VRYLTRRAAPTGDSGMPQITYDDFAKVDIRVGRIVHVDDWIA
jgi:hypothetical protein